MVQTSRLADEQRRTLADLARVPELARFHLAGGSAVAWHLGHRISRDLDLFRTDSETDLELVRAAVQRDVVGTEVVSVTDAAVHLRIRGLPVDFVRYPHPLLEAPEHTEEGIPVAGLLDLATMKLAAISRRGIRRDFWDLWAICTRSGIDLTATLTAYRQRFGVGEPDLYPVLRALTYFDDAEAEAVFPAGLTEERWLEIRAYFQRAAPKTFNELE